MCLLLVKYAGKEIEDNLLKQMWSDNKDGFGTCYSKDNELIITKGMIFDDFIKHIKSIPIEQEIVVHTRWGNIGSKKLYNCHPFRISEDFCMFHNGSITIDRPMKEMSDTYSFAHNIIAPLLKRRPEIFLEDSFRKIVEEAIGVNNKLVMMRKDGKIVIFNERQGQMYKGLWVSNGRSLYGSHWGNGQVVSCTYTPGNTAPNRPTTTNTQNPIPDTVWDGMEGYYG